MSAPPTSSPAGASAAGHPTGKVQMHAGWEDGLAIMLGVAVASFGLFLYTSQASF